MFDTRPALADLATQIRSMRSSDGLTLQQLATRSGVAASTIHKIEAQQMVPTVSVLLKISKGLGRRPQDLIRDEIIGSESVDYVTETPNTRAGAGEARRVGVWRIDVDTDQSLPSFELDAHQHVIVVIEKGAIELQSNDEQLPLVAGDCVEFDGERRLGSASVQSNPVSLTLIVSPPSNLDLLLGNTGNLRLLAS